VPLFISDDWDPFEEALLNVWKAQQPPYGDRTKPKPVLVRGRLKYAQVCKNVRRKCGCVVKRVDLGFRGYSINIGCGC
jgi:hypothetical protein